MRTHPSDADSDHMPANERATGGSDPRRYEIRVRGPIGPTIMQAFPTLSASRSGQDTLLTGSLPDHSALYGVIHELEALGLQLLEIRCGSRSYPSESSEHFDAPDGKLSMKNRLPDEIFRYGRR
jgi:hypothetical protein